jgi:KUP system potassium uptake protein
MSANHMKSSSTALLVGALGIVFGDIGTSPLYAFKQLFASGNTVSQTVVYGCISMIFWSMAIILCLKYASFVTRHDNEGEGGAMAMTALVVRNLAQKSYSRQIVVFIGIVATALFFGDGAITPAISVLSAMEGLTVANPSFHHYVIPIALTIICGLFLIQKKGTDKVGKFFGPIMILWFSTLALLGLNQIIKHPDILSALSPYWAFHYFCENGMAGFSIFAVITLSITGCEALYADMGHFGRKPILKCWYVFVMPALLLNYMGQAAMAMTDPTSVSNPFFNLAPDWALYPLIGLSVLATIIASQAVITGVFSVCNQGITLGLIPRLKVEYTSNKEMGQIYIPAVNFILFIMVIGIVLSFKSSEALASAYGLAVTGTMTLTTILAAINFRLSFKWSWFKVAIFATLFLTVDAVFLSANLNKIAEGGWLPIVLGLFFMILMLTWKKGKDFSRLKNTTNSINLKEMIQSLLFDMPHRIEGCSVFLYAIENAVPPCFLHNLKHNQVIHQNVLFLTVKIEKKPFVSEHDRLRICDLGNGFYKGVLTFGFRESTDIPRTLKRHAEHKGFPYQSSEISYFLNRECLVDTGKLGGPLGLFSKMYILMARNASNVGEYFKLPANQVIELGQRVDI